MEALALLAVIALCVFLAWVALRIEPHYASKDGRKFLCMGQKLTTTGEPIGRAHESHVVVKPDGQLEVEQKRFLRRTATFWRVEARAPAPPKRKVVFLLRGHDDNGLPILLALRMPAGSRVVPTLDALVRPARSSTTSPSPS